jgi:Arc/MetJ-type ribon-helix-helix transcriptional regulator
MNDLHIQLPEPIHSFAGAQVSSGRFQSMSDYVGALVSADEKSQQAIRGLNDNPKLAGLLDKGLSGDAGRREGRI